MKRFAMAAGFIAALVAVVVLAAARSNTGGQGGAAVLQVAATHYPLYEFARQIGGSKVQATNLTPAGAEPHDYEPTPKDIAAAQRSKVFIYNGAMEPWTTGFVQDYRHTAVRVSAGIPTLTAADADHAGQPVQDPHFWLDPVLAQQMVATIQRGLAAADPANAAYYAKNAQQYTQQLKQLDAAYRSGLADCRLRTVISSHDAFSYIGKRYNLTISAIAGLSPSEEPSAARLSSISQLVRQHGIGYIFFESLASPRLADTIAAETGAKTLVFDPIEGLTDADQEHGKNYLSIQYENLQNLRTALSCL